jgi:hypothetical protein
MAFVPVFLSCTVTEPPLGVKFNGLLKRLAKIRCNLASSPHTRQLTVSETVIGLVTETLLSAACTRHVSTLALINCFTSISLNSRRS